MIFETDGYNNVQLVDWYYQFPELPVGAVGQKAWLKIISQDDQRFIFCGQAYFTIIVQPA